MADNDNDTGDGEHIDYEKLAARVAAGEPMTENGVEVTVDVLDDQNAKGKEPVPVTSSKAKPITAEETRALERMREEMAKVDITAYDDKGLLRHLREEAGDVDMAIAFAKEAVIFNQMFQPSKLMINDVAHTLRFYEMYIGGRARNGDITLWFENYKLHCPALNNGLDLVMAALYLMRCAFETAGSEKVFFCAELAGLKIKMFDERLERISMELFSLFFPDTLGDFIMIHTPLWIKALFVIVSPWLPKQWTERLHVIRNEVKLLQKYIARDQLPTRYTGTLEDQDLCVESFIRKRAEIEGIDPNSGPTHSVDQRVILWLSRSEVPARSIENVTFSGTLRKMGGIVKLWKKFFVVVHSGALFYFKDEKELAPMGVILLDRVEITQKQKKSSNHEFQVVTQKRTFYFRCDSIAKQDQWVKALNEEAQKAEVDLPNREPVPLSNTPFYQKYKSGQS